jgi:hypothetical protein
MHPGAAIGRATALVRGDDLDREALVGLGPLGDGTFLPGVEAAARDAQDAAHGLDGEGHLLLFDEGEFHSLSFAK